MIFVYNANGDLLSKVPSRVYQGSNKASRIYFVAPFPESNVLDLAFTLPNGDLLPKRMMTGLKDRTEIEQLKIDGVGVSVWFYDLIDTITAYAGEVTAQFFVTSATEIVATEKAIFSVEKGVAPIEAPEDIDTYELIQQAISQINSSLSNVNLEIEELKKKAVEGIVQETGESTDKVMSQKASTKSFYKIGSNPNLVTLGPEEGARPVENKTINGVVIGYGSKSDSTNDDGELGTIGGAAIGQNAVSFRGAVAIGHGVGAALYGVNVGIRNGSQTNPGNFQIFLGSDLHFGETGIDKTILIGRKLKASKRNQIGIGWGEELNSTTIPEDSKIYLFSDNKAWLDIKTNGDVYVLGTKMLKPSDLPKLRLPDLYTLSCRITINIVDASGNRIKGYACAQKTSQTRYVEDVPKYNDTLDQTLSKLKAYAGMCNGRVKRTFSNGSVQNLTIIQLQAVTDGNGITFHVIEESSGNATTIKIDESITGTFYGQTGSTVILQGGIL